MQLKTVTLHPEKYPTGKHYPFNLPLFRETTQVVFDAPVTLFIGENGTGKSPLLEALARTCNIHIWRNADGSRPEHNPYEGLFHRYYEETDHYRIYKDFLEDRKKYLPAG